MDPFSPEFWREYQRKKKRPEEERFLRPDFWDRLAEDYDELEENPTYRNMVSEVVSELKTAGALSPQEEVFDVCCGTGIYAVRFAPFVKRVFALDVSKEMLKVLKRKLETLRLKNVEVVESDWRSYREQRKFYTVFVSLSPILNDLSEVDRLLSYAERFFAVVQWAGLRENELHKEVLKEFFGEELPKPPPKAVVLFNYLFSLGYAPRVRFFTGVWERERDPEKEAERLFLRWETEGRRLDQGLKERIRKFICAKARGGKLKVKTKVRLGFLLVDVNEYRPL